LIYLIFLKTYWKVPLLPFIARLEGGLQISEVLTWMPSSSSTIGQKTPTPIRKNWNQWVDKKFKFRKNVFIHLEDGPSIDSIDQWTERIIGPWIHQNKHDLGKHCTDMVVVGYRGRDESLDYIWQSQGSLISGIFCFHKHIALSQRDPRNWDCLTLQVLFDDHSCIDFPE
jgi:hypothetical protein